MPAVTVGTSRVPYGLTGTGRALPPRHQKKKEGLKKGAQEQETARRLLY